MAEPTLREMLMERQRARVNGTVGQPYRPPLMQGLGALADLVNGFAGYADRVGVTVPQWSPVARGKSLTLKDLTVGELGPVLEDMSYGMGPMRGGNYATGGLGTLGQADPKIMEIGNMIPAAALTGKALVKGGKSLAPTMSEMLRQKSESFMRGQGLLRDVTAYHGSPHKFDRFDASKIGTGEGAQQQAVGSYLSEQKLIGQKYADKEAFKRGLEKGFVYTVDLPDSMVARMGNYDAPLLEQSDYVKSVVEKLLGSEEQRALSAYYGWNSAENAPLAAILGAMDIANGNNRNLTASVLRQAGIPGIRYLDGASRGVGAGTSNFVVFPGEESAVKIIKRE